jgi:hypothetical protein
MLFLRRQEGKLSFRGSEVLVMIWVIYSVTGLFNPVVVPVGLTENGLLFL